MTYVIWSFKHGQWWRPNKQGYTPHLEEAGHYTAQEAGEITTGATFCESVAIMTVVAKDLGAPTVKGLWA